MYKINQDELKEIKQIISRRNIKLLEYIAIEQQLNSSQCEEIKETLVEEFCEFGLKKNSEPNKYGLKIESMIDNIDKLGLHG